MAGYVLKITIEGTHPPVWRRIVVPEKITFEELHNIIQIIFGWENEHLHAFTIPSENVVIDDEEDSMDHFREDRTLLEQFIFDYKWIRYTYDFGDDWRHKIVCEKTDDDYDKRYAILLKYKGDNFLEDSRGNWEEENRSVFDETGVIAALEALLCPLHEDLSVERVYDVEEELNRLAKKFVKKMLHDFKSGSGTHKQSAESAMSKKVNAWKEFQKKWKGNAKKDQDQEYTQLTLPFAKPEEIEKPEGNVLEIVAGGKTNAELLKALGKKEAEDYCKYLRLPLDSSCAKSQLTDAVSKVFLEKPEYLLYVFCEEEYQELLKWIKMPCGIVKERPKQVKMIIKAIALGLADISVSSQKGGCRAKLCFAKDVQELLLPLKESFRKQIYRELKLFSKHLQEIILFYGVVDLDSLYNMYCQIYHKKMGKEDFLRYVYWHASFNDQIRTGYSAAGIGYAAAVQMDMESVLEDMGEYAGGLDYVLYSASELKKLTDDISMRNDNLDIIYTILSFELRLPDEVVVPVLEQIFVDVMNGDSLETVLDGLYDMISDELDLNILSELWECISGLMLELELPMLKGRSRIQYAQEMRISPWKIGMIWEDSKEKSLNEKERHMYEFPSEIQESMYDACSYADESGRKKLLHYKTKENVKSEEFLYLLAEAHITACEFGNAIKLIEELKKSSRRGMRAASRLECRVKDGQEAIDDEDDFDMFSRDDWEYQSGPVQMPYVRENPKIGRNDPCPCGSGKKYKKCCGR